MTARPLVLPPSDIPTALAGQQVRHRVPLTAETCTVNGSRWKAADAAWTGLYLHLADPVQWKESRPHLTVPFWHPVDRERCGDVVDDMFYRVRSRVEIGDVFWAREAWWHDRDNGGSEHGYMADGFPYDGNCTVKRCSAACMPRCESRLTLTVTDIAFERDGDAWWIEMTMELAR